MKITFKIIIGLAIYFSLNGCILSYSLHKDIKRYKRDFSEFEIKNGIAIGWAKKTTKTENIEIFSNNILYSKTPEQRTLVIRIDQNKSPIQVDIVELAFQKIDTEIMEEISIIIKQNPEKPSYSNVETSAEPTKEPSGKWIELQPVNDKEYPILTTFNFQNEIIVSKAKIHLNWVKRKKYNIAIMSSVYFLTVPVDAALITVSVILIAAINSNDTSD
jgi:hypothetical protein